jgi:hypothetical protein
MVRFRADSSNAGRVAIGAAPGPVTLPAGTLNTTAGIVLGAGADSDWIYIDNLNKLAYIGSDGSQKLSYILLR